MVKKSKEPADLTVEEKKIIAETKILEKRETIPQKTGVVLTGGIDSTVNLCITKRTKAMEIQPIVFKEEGVDNTEAINKILDKEGIPKDIQYFENTKTKGGKKEVLQWCFENNINPLSFGANIEERDHNIGSQEMLEWKQLASEMNNSGVQIVDSLSVVNKSEIIKWAKDKYDILELTAKPSDSSKFKKIREEAFQLAKIEDPHVEKEETSKE
jgi:hypothetical protein